MEVRPLTHDEWRLKRDLRLAALKDSPDAFASSYAREAHRSEADWRTWPPGGALFAAFASSASARGPAFASSAALPGPVTVSSAAPPGPVTVPSAVPPGPVTVSCAPPVGPGAREPLGIAGTWVAAGDPRTTHLISMWVAPVARGRGVAALLIDAVTGWARARGHDTVELEVARGNTPAMTAYLRHGFVVTQREPFTTGGTVLILPVK